LSFSQPTTVLEAGFRILVLIAILLSSEVLPSLVLSKLSISAFNGFLVLVLVISGAGSLSSDF